MTIYENDILTARLLPSLFRRLFVWLHEPLANANLSGLYVNSIEQVLRLPPDQIDVGIAALIVSEAWSDMVAGRRYQQQLDDMAMEIRSRLKTTKPTRRRYPRHQRLSV